MRQGMTTAPRRVATILMAATASLTVIALPTSASAHTELAGTVPAAGSVSESPVSGVSLEFAAPILPELTTVVVTRGGSGVQVEEPVVDGSTVATTMKGRAQPGEYTVAYRAVAADGHAITGSFSFEVAPRPDSEAPAPVPVRRRDGAVTAAGPGPATATPETPVRSTVASPADGEPIRLDALGILGAGAAVAVGAGLLRRRALT